MGLLAWMRSRKLRSAATEAMRQGRLREAAAAFARYLEVRPADWEAWGYLGDCHYDLGEPDPAERALRRSLELNPQGEEARETLALLAGERDGAWEVCLSMLEECLRQTSDAGIPEFTELSLAWAHYLQHDEAKAREHFDRAVGGVEAEEAERDAVMAPVEYRVGVLYHALRHDDARALVHLREVVRLSPESIFARRAQELIGGLIAKAER